MGTFHLELFIDRPTRDVFEVVADPATMPLWYDAVTQVTKTSAGPAATGATYQITRSLPGGEAHNTVEITEHETDRSVIIESRDGPTPFRYHYTFETDHRATVLTLDGRISAAGLPGPAGRLDPLASLLFTRGMRRNLQQLKRLVERGRAAPDDATISSSSRP
jgi:uncharacterized protein YndB with AHSA1/START domain